MTLSPLEPRVFFGVRWPSDVAGSLRPPGWRGPESNRRHHDFQGHATRALGDIRRLRGPKRVQRQDEWQPFAQLA